MNASKCLALCAALFLAVTLFASPVLAQQARPTLDKWKPDFDPSTAAYKFKVSNVSHPAIKGVYAGFAIRDELWKRTDGRMYLEYIPFSMLGGEVEVLNQLQMGAIQGMSVSSVASTNLGPRMGVVNLPFLVDSFEKLDRFAGNPELFTHFLAGMEHQGIMGLDITGYGNYGWATMTPVRNLADARKVKIRIAEAAVNRLSYESWGFNPVVMPWPDVPAALQRGVITGLDHTPIVCQLTKKFEVCKYFTQINYAQGLFIWIFNKAWFEGLPEDLQHVFKEVVRDVSADIRAQSVLQEDEEIANAKAAGVEFIRLPEEEMNLLRKQAKAVHDRYAKEIGEEYLKQVQEFMGYTAE